MDGCGTQLIIMYLLIGAGWHHYLEQQKAGYPVQWGTRMLSALCKIKCGILLQLNWPCRVIVSQGRIPYSSGSFLRTTLKVTLECLVNNFFSLLHRVLDVILTKDASSSICYFALLWFSCCHNSWNCMVAGLSGWNCLMSLKSGIWCR